LAKVAAVEEAKLAVAGGRAAAAAQELEN